MTIMRPAEHTLLLQLTHMKDTFALVGSLVTKRMTLWRKKRLVFLIEMPNQNE